MLNSLQSGSSERTDIEVGVPQGSILGPILLNINMINIFYECKDSNLQLMLTTQHRIHVQKNTPSVALELQVSTIKLFRWFKSNYLRANPGKSHILLSSKKPEIVSVDGISLAGSSPKKLLAVTIDSELRSENHITEQVLCH